jgi:hypothetical protein
MFWRNIITIHFKVFMNRLDYSISLAIMKIVEGRQPFHKYTHIFTEGQKWICADRAKLGQSYYQTATVGQWEIKHLKLPHTLVKKYKQQ